MLRRAHDHHRDLPARRSTALSASAANRRHQDRHLMSTIAQTRYRNAAHHCRWFSAGRGGACSKPALRLRYVSRSSPLAAREYHRNSALSRIVRIDGAAQPYRLLSAAPPPPPTSPPVSPPAISSFGGLRTPALKPLSSPPPPSPAGIRKPSQYQKSASLSFLPPWRAI